jgi:uncharacterized protein
MINRAIDLKALDESFFLWGPRQAGKTMLLKSTFPSAHYVDLLLSDQFVKYQTHPERLRQELLHLIERQTPPQIVIIDEIQKVPALLDEVHWMIENWKLQFGLCGSSARKVRRGQANLLGGRARRFELHGLSAVELGKEFDLVRMLNHGYLPRHYLSERPAALIRAYTTDYLKEEIAAEGLVRNLSAFADLIEAAALSDAEIVNFSNIARELGISQPTVRSYFEILEDTLLARFLPAYRRRPKRRVIIAPKFYMFDVGIVNYLAKRGSVVPGGELFGKAFENWVLHELICHRDYLHPGTDLAYWRLPSGIEVDFILGSMEIAVEAKATASVAAQHLKGLRAVVEDHPRIRRRIVVCLEKTPRRTDDGIEILPAGSFLEQLKQNSLLPSA